MEKCFCRELSKFGIDISEDNAKYMLTIDGEQDIQEYMYGLLDQDDPKCREFVNELIKKKKHVRSRSSPQCVSFPSDGTLYKKTSVEDLVSPINMKSKEKHQQANEKDHDSSSSSGVKDGARKKSKFVPLYSEEGQKQAVVKLKGRHECECQATKHALVSNCLNCGRVVCEQEGSGPCLFCSNLVCTNEESEILSLNSKKSEKLRNFLINLGGGGKIPLQQKKAENSRKAESLRKTEIKQKSDGPVKTDGQQKAVEYKDRLLEYDRMSAKRTQVIDDESDYFSLESKWLSQEQRDLLEAEERVIRERKSDSRKQQRITLDFAGRRVLDASDDSSVYREGESIAREILEGGCGGSSTAAYTARVTGPTTAFTAPVYIMPEESYSSKLLSERSHGGERSRGGDDPRATLRLQDRELREMSDLGVCLSMHQPWASLLVAGVKVHEGRTWYTVHRGRLWIAATAKAASQAEIDQVVQSYRYICGDKNIKFHQTYPVSCLLGCVDVVDCLDQETYTQKFPQGESVSPYVFICENPQTLLVNFPIKGKHKIYKLEKHIHEGAKKGLRPS